MNLTDYETRRKEILLTIIHSYIATALPVGSQTVAKTTLLGLSAATIRNVMADLEEEGYITHPHTSAGRIPTHKGYRFYVDQLIEGERLSEEECRQIEEVFQARQQWVEDLLQKTAHLLSTMTRQVAFCLSPLLTASSVKRLEMIPVENRQLLVVLVSSSGLVRNALIRLSEEINREELARLSTFLNSELEGMTLGEAMSYLYQRLLDERSPFFHICKRARDILEQSGLMESEDSLFLEGTGNILEKPEFQDAEHVRPLLRILEEKTLLLRVLRQDEESEGLHIHIGEEHGVEGIRDCTLITGTYRTGRKGMGTVGVIGPTRLNYSRTISVVESIARKLSEISEAFGL